MDRITRIKKMEKAYDELERAVIELERAQAVLSKAGKNCKKLSKYYAREWREDFEADEQGLIPGDVRRGVLSEDGLYDLLERYEEAKASVLSELS
ncbi:MAG: DUF4298 domain-containing protein [Clostridia bacterium]|nr:DUF4298 domain-containing protein [Clostridia bacterium]